MAAIAGRAYCHSSDPTRSPSSTTSYVPRRILASGFPGLAISPSASRVRNSTATSTASSTATSTNSAARCVGRELCATGCRHTQPRHRPRPPARRFATLRQAVTVISPSAPRHSPTGTYSNGSGFSALSPRGCRHAADSRASRHRRSSTSPTRLSRRACSARTQRHCCTRAPLLRLSRAKVPCLEPYSSRLWARRRTGRRYHHHDGNDRIQTSRRIAVIPAVLLGP